MKVAKAQAFSFYGQCRVSASEWQESCLRLKNRIIQEFCDFSNIENGTRHQGLERLNNGEGIKLNRRLDTNQVLSVVESLATTDSCESNSIKMQSHGNFLVKVKISFDVHTWQEIEIKCFNHQQWFKSDMRFEKLNAETEVTAWYRVILATSFHPKRVYLFTSDSETDDNIVKSSNFQLFWIIKISNQHTFCKTNQNLTSSHAIIKARTTLQSLFCLSSTKFIKFLCWRWRRTIYFRSSLKLRHFTVSNTSAKIIRGSKSKFIWTSSLKLRRSFQSFLDSLDDCWSDHVWFSSSWDNFEVSGWSSHFATFGSTTLSRWDSISSSHNLSRNTRWWRNSRKCVGKVSQSENLISKCDTRWFNVNLIWFQSSSLSHDGSHVRSIIPSTTQPLVWFWLSRRSHQEKFSNVLAWMEYLRWVENTFECSVLFDINEMGFLFHLQYATSWWALEHREVFESRSSTEIFTF